MNNIISDAKKILDLMVDDFSGTHCQSVPLLSLVARRTDCKDKERPKQSVLLSSIYTPDVEMDG